MHLHFTALKMASNLTTQGQEFVVCDLCQNPVSSTIISKFIARSMKEKQ